uniref:F-box/LRR-repeat protein 12-like n=1 Tax=Erigeron canadensis TaxID=72917 RepID=UPI001CB8ADB1|nr:F-box/LRR-repeat protein 12-like [Erigeron canadensis]
MDVGVTKQNSCITHLRDEDLCLIFDKLYKTCDRESFGLTCRRFLEIQNSNSKCLELGRSSWPKRTRVIYDGTDPLILDKLLNRFRNVESLSFTHCDKLSDSDLTRLQEYGSKLQSLSLSYCRLVTDIGLTSVASGCPFLSIISLRECSISDHGLEILTKSCKSLTEVNLNGCSSITDKGILSLNQNCREIRAISIAGCKEIRGVGFKGISPTLIILEANSCDFDLAGVTGIISGGGLKYLNLSYSYKREQGLAILVSGSASNLRILDLMRCNFVDDAAIESISKGCPLLEEWNLSFCDEIGISGWESIGLNCHNLEIIYVHGCKKLCDKGLLALGNGCERLSKVYMNTKYGKNITRSGKLMFKTQRPDVKIEQEISMKTNFPFWKFTWPYTRWLWD